MYKPGMIIFVLFSLLTWPLSADLKTNTKIKNVLFIIADDLKANVLSSYGDPLCKTPNLDKLAEEGIVFQRAYAQGSFCVPSRPSLMFSRYTLAKTNPEIHKSFPQVMKENGWYSARVGKVYHMAVPNDIVDGTDGHEHPKSWTEKFNCSGKEESTAGLYQGLNRNIFTREMEGRAGAGHKDRMFVAVKMEGDGSDQPDFKAANKAVELLRKHKDKPFILALGFVRPHYPHVSPAKHFDMYPLNTIKLPERVDNDWADIPKQGLGKSTSKSTGMDKYPENQKRMWAAYYANVSFMDEQLGKVLKELDVLGLRKNTAIVFTSDHGYHLGEHDLWQKMNLHEDVTRVPLIISAPGYKTGVSGSVVELVDIFPTVLDLVGLSIPEQCHGKSIKKILVDPKNEIRDYAFSYHGGKDPKQFSIRTKKWAFIKYPNGEELYDMEKDPKQFKNLSANPEYKKALEEYREILAQKLKSYQ